MLYGPILMESFAARKQRTFVPRRGKDMLYSGKVCLLKVTAAMSSDLAAEDIVEEQCGERA
jgi:hypothetical protein